MATDERSEQELRERVNELEGRLDDLTTDGEVATDAQGREWTIADLMNLGLTRRQALGAITTLATGATLWGAIQESIGTARAVGSGEVGQLGEPGRPIDAYVEDLYDTNGNPVLEFEGDGSIASVNTDELFGTFSDKIRVIVDGETIAAIPTGSSSQPLNDAIDLCAAEGGGIVKRPASLIQQNESVKPKEGVSVTGPDVRKDALSGVQITSSGESGIEFTENVGNTRQDYGAIIGSGTGTAQGPAIHWKAGSGGGFIRFGATRIDQWGGQAWREEFGGSPYQADIPMFITGASMDPSTNGDTSIMEFNSLHPTLRFGHITLQTQSQMDGINAGGGDLQIGTLAVGRATSTAIDHSEGILEVGTIEWEPTERTSTTPQVFRLTSDRMAWIWSGRIDAQEVENGNEEQDILYWCRVAAGEKHHIHIPQVKSAPGYINDVDVSVAPTGPSYYYGSDSGVNDRDNADNGNLRSLASAGTSSS